MLSPSNINGLCPRRVPFDKLRVTSHLFDEKYSPCHAEPVEALIDYDLPRASFDKLRVTSHLIDRKLHPVMLSLSKH